MKFAKSLVMLLLALVALPAITRSAAAAEGSKKLALLVGIEHYGLRYTPAVPAHEQWSQLDGSRNDVAMLKAELEHRGFDVLTLVDEQATHKAIVAAFQQQLVDKADKDAVVFFHYSGHGQQIPDDNGAPDEADGYDEALVPFDNLGINNYANHIRDDELGLLIAQAAKKSENIVISLDSCHSGTATRGAPGDPRKMRTRGSRPMWPPAEKRGNEADGTGAWVPAGDAKGAGYVFISAVRADQEANEDRDPVSGAAMGAYSLMLAQALHDAGPRTSYRDLLERIGAQIVVRVSDQNPQIEGDADKRLFSGEWAPPSKFYRVRPITGDGELPIEAGSLHGLLPGSELEVRAIGGEKPLVRVKLVRVELGMSYGVPVKDGERLEAKLFDKGSQAQEVLTKVQAARVRVAFDAAAIALQATVEKLPFVEIMGPQAASAALPQWDLLLTKDMESGGLRIQRADGTALPIPRGKNQPMAGAVAIDDPQRDLRVTQAIEAQFRKMRVMALENNDVATRLEVDLTVHRVDAALEVAPNGSKHVKITADHGAVAKDGTGKVKAGEIVQLFVENRGTKPCFFSVIELSADGTIGILFPAPNAPGDNLLKPGEKRAIPYPYRMTPPAGPEIIKVIASEDDVDFRALEFKVTRGASAGARSPLEQRMGELFSKTRGEPFGYAPEKLWGTDVARFEILQ